MCRQEDGLGISGFWRGRTADRGNNGRGGAGLGEEKDVRAIGETGRRKKRKRTGQQVIILSLAKVVRGSFVSPGTADDPGQ